MSIKQLLYLGLLSPIIFWITTIVCGLMLDDYNHLTWLVSELGALGTRTQYLFTTGLVLSSILNLFLVVGLYKYCKKQQLSIIPILFHLFYSFLIGPALFPMPLGLHGIVGLPFPLIMLAPIMSLIFWRKKEYLLKIRVVAIISFLIMILGFLIYFPNILNEYFGLKQLFMYVGWTVWSIYLPYRILQLNNNNMNTFPYQSNFVLVFREIKLPIYLHSAAA